MPARFSIACAILIFGLVSGCNLYRSSDRESFNSGAVAGAPTPTPTPTPGFLQAATINCGSFAGASLTAGVGKEIDEVEWVERRSDFTVLRITRRGTKGRSIEVCEVGFFVPTGWTLSDQALVDAARIALAARSSEEI